MLYSKRQPQIGDIYTMRFEGSGNEQQGKRPGLVFQNNTGNKFSPNIIALPLTSVIKRSDLPTHVVVPAEETGLYKDSMVLCENPTCISKDKIGEYITTLPKSLMHKVAAANLLASSAISFLNPEELISVWTKAIGLNNCLS